MLELALGTILCWLFWQTCDDLNSPKVSQVYYTKTFEIDVCHVSLGILLFLNKIKGAMLHNSYIYFITLSHSPKSSALAISKRT